MSDLEETVVIRRAMSYRDFAARLAYYAVIQHPYHRPPGLLDLIGRFIAEWRDSPLFPIQGVGDLTLEQVGEVMAWFDGQPELEGWNTPRSGHASPFAFVSVFGGPAPEDDFIDIGAMLCNIEHAVWADAAEYQSERSS